MEPIVARDVIRELARTAAEAGKQLHECNPYLVGTAAHRQFETDYWAREREITQEIEV